MSSPFIKNKNKNQPEKKFLVSLRLAGLVILLLASSYSFTKAAPESLDAQQQQLLEERRQNDQASMERDVEYVTAFLTQITDQAKATCRPVYQGKPQKGGGSSGGGEYVPVQEIGELLKVAQGTQKTAEIIDTNTGKTSEILEKVCNYVVMSEQIEEELLKKDLILDPAARRSTASAVEEYIHQDFNLQKEGYSKIKDGEEIVAPLYVTNYQQHYDEVVKERTQVVLDEMRQIAQRNPNDPYINDVLSATDQQQNQSIDNKIVGTLTQEQIDQTLDPNSNVPVSQREEWLLSYYYPTVGNNPMTKFLLVNDELERQKASALQAAQDELRDGQGALPVRKCKRYTSDGKYCAEWEIVTPAIVNLQSILDALAARLNMLINTEKAVGSSLTDHNNYLLDTSPQIESVYNFSPYGYSDTGAVSPNGDFDGDGNINSSDPDDDNDGTPDAYDIDPFDDTSTSTIPISIVFTYDLDEGQSSATIEWTAAQATEIGFTTCQAKNRWLTSGGNNTVNVAKVAGSALTRVGSTTVNLPLAFQTRLQRERAGAVVSYEIASSSIGYGHLAIITLPSNIETGDKFTISFAPFDSANSVTVTVGANTDRSALVGQFRSALNNRFNQFQFIFSDSTGKINVFALSDYEIKCSGTYNVSGMSGTLVGEAAIRI